MLAYIKFEEREKALARRIGRRRLILDVLEAVFYAWLVYGLCLLAAFAFPPTVP